MRFYHTKYQIRNYTFQETAKMMALVMLGHVSASDEQKQEILDRSNDFHRAGLFSPAIAAGKICGQWGDKTFSFIVANAEKEIDSWGWNTDLNGGE